MSAFRLVDALRNVPFETAVFKPGFVGSQSAVGDDEEMWITGASVLIPISSCEGVDNSLI
jgi:hypothetical protein